MPALLVTPIRKCDISPMIYPVVIRNKKFKFAGVQSEDLVFTSGVSVAELIIEERFSNSQSQVIDCNLNYRVTAVSQECDVKRNVETQ